MLVTVVVWIVTTFEARLEPVCAATAKICFEQPLATRSFNQIQNDCVPMSIPGPPPARHAPWFQVTLSMLKPDEPPKPPLRLLFESIPYLTYVLRKSENPMFLIAVF